MGLIKGFLMSLGMFSIIPVPKNSWNEKYNSLLMPSLPLVGLIIGFVWYGVSYALQYFSVPLLINSVIVLFVPFILSGLIHADGYMDTADAVFSRRDLTEKKRILKDPNTGAFAVISIIGLILFQFCIIHTILDQQKPLWVFVFIPVMSRCIAGIAVLNIKPLFESGYQVMFKKDSKPRHTIFICLFTVALFFTAWFKLDISLFPLLSGVLAGILTAIYLYRHFKGLSGDLCGSIIIISEFSALLCLALI